MQLLLRYLGVHAAVSTLLCATLFRPDAATDPNAAAKHDTHLSSTPSVPVPAGLRKGVRVRWRMHDMPLCATDNAYCDTDPWDMQPARTRLPFRDNVRLLLRDMGMPAARRHLL